MSLGTRTFCESTGLFVEISDRDNVGHKADRSIVVLDGHLHRVTGSITSVRSILKELVP